MTLPPDRMKFIANIANDEWAYDLPEHDSQDENDKEFAKHEPKWIKIREDYLATSESAEELHEFVKQHHWGEADDFLVLIENSTCDRNTARLVFWLTGAEHYRRHYASRADIAGDSKKKWWDLIHLISDNLVSGKYANEVMPEDYKQNIPSEKEYWENEPLWEIDPLMYGDR